MNLEQALLKLKEHTSEIKDLLNNSINFINKDGVPSLKKIVYDKTKNFCSFNNKRLYEKDELLTFNKLRNNSVINFILKKVDYRDSNNDLQTKVEEEIIEVKGLENKAFNCLEDNISSSPLNDKFKYLKPSEFRGVYTQICRTQQDSVGTEQIIVNKSKNFVFDSPYMFNFNRELEDNFKLKKGTFNIDENKKDYEYLYNGELKDENKGYSYNDEDFELRIPYLLDEDFYFDGDGNLIRMYIKKRVG